ncbi:Cargo receptor for soluble protein [Schizosaccharomyces pombe]|uniref:Surfeit locus protein 4 homolog n=1 Tax=Schizosaccharomyces pombe (strain 972 / ATCC 24843) TaxID=284812 RepID=SURF4_SCHPO|nr:putative cargo receptor protein [Schizosaccharomyces pombe]O74559.1 RecName: Full=Surfeit locus protein 4 homolog [Schizosaccharomyces pombe 972h-]CAA20699.1 cargo receptor for soluble proteins (predicted) [Schizosaccharomyces pombe]|eukprot:NP_587849.1 putative cargo receptor protein [Schizosaccharomyces pombe]
MTSRSPFSTIPLSMNQDSYQTRTTVGIRKKTFSERACQFMEQAETFMAPFTPYMPLLGRFLIVATYFEDAIRIVTQWPEQVSYMRDYRRFRFGTAPLLLFVCVVLMLVGSTLVVFKKRQAYAIGSLLFVTLLQAFAYGLITSGEMFFRNMSVIGGLCLVASDTFIHRRINRFAGLPAVSEHNKRTYFQLAGRVLLIFMFLGLLAKEGSGISWTRILVHILSVTACAMVVIGFKAKFFAAVLVLILSVANFIINSFWSVPRESPYRDFYRYDFFQTLSIVGGLLYLVNTGPGKFSVDEKKKIY